MLKHIGFLGLGTVGKHMAINLLKGNYNLTVYDSNAEVMAELVKLGATGAGSPREAAKGKDLVIHIRPEKERLRQDIYGPKAYSPASTPARPSSTWAPTPWKAPPRLPRKRPNAGSCSSMRRSGGPRSTPPTVSSPSSPGVTRPFWPAAANPSPSSASTSSMWADR